MDIDDNNSGQRASYSRNYPDIYIILYFQSSPVKGRKIIPISAMTDLVGVRKAVS